MFLNQILIKNISCAGFYTLMMPEKQQNNKIGTKEQMQQDKGLFDERLVTRHRHTGSPIASI